MSTGPVTWTNMTHMVIRTPSALSSRTSTSLSAQQKQENERAQLAFLAKQTNILRDALDRIRTSWRRTTGGIEAQAARATSGVDLQLAQGTAATLRSSEEVNATPTSFSPQAPSWTGSSTAAPTVGGVYGGNQGDDTLTFTVTRGGTIGSRLLRLAVTDSGGGPAGNIVVGRRDVPGEIYTLPNGLEISFAAGELVEGDTFTVDVSATVGSSVDPGTAFDRDPRLEDGYAVTAGAFTVNGATITVLADDTIYSVLSSINQSAAGVSAAFDLATESVVLTQDSLGTSHDILLGGDSSGFLAATKLDTATVTTGTDGDAQRPLSDLPLFAGVTAGSFLVNGASIAVNPGSDSLEDLIGRISAAGAGVTAAIDLSGQRIILTSDDVEADLVLDDNGTGFLPALAMTEGTISPRQTSGAGMSRTRARDVAEATRDAVQAINAIFSYEAPGGEPASFLEKARKDLTAALEGAVKDDRKGIAEYVGLEMDFEAPSGNVLTDSNRLERRLMSAFRKRTTAAENFLFGRESGEGLIGLLEIRQGSILKNLELTAGFRGLTLDSLA